MSGLLKRGTYAVLLITGGIFAYSCLAQQDCQALRRLHSTEVEVLKQNPSWQALFRLNAEVSDKNDFYVSVIQGKDNFIAPPDYVQMKASDIRPGTFEFFSSVLIPVNSGRSIYYSFDESGGVYVVIIVQGHRSWILTSSLNSRFELVSDEIPAIDTMR
jgi:hypothetical protein